MKKKMVHISVGLVIAMMSLVFVPALFGAEIDCLKCHAKLKAGKVHAAVDMGCGTCHGGIDASKVPHKKTNKIARGLNSDQPDLCYGCHDKKAFEKKNVHAAVGCAGCHDPHSSKNAKLLKSEAPDLCYTCHDKKGFTRKVVHSPVQGGMCLTCHSPHASDEMALLLAEPEATCTNCHPDVLKKIHALSGYGSVGHPVQTKTTLKVKTEKGKDMEERVTVRKDPARPNRVFYCGSCHEPHSTAGARLLRYNARSGMQLCGHCHKY